MFLMHPLRLWSYPCTDIFVLQNKTMEQQDKRTLALSLSRYIYTCCVCALPTYDESIGIRKSGSRDTTTPMEELAVKDSMNAIHRAQASFNLPLTVVVLVMDGTRRDSATVVSRLRYEFGAFAVQTVAT